MKVIKRNGTEVEFDKGKIINAIEKAMYETELGIDGELSEEVAYNIQEDVLEMGITPTVNSIQDMVEEYLMNSDRKDVAKRYILYRSERDRNRNKMWKMTDLQRDIYQKKYRYNNESFSGFLDRVSGGNTYVRKLIQEKRFIPAGRILASRGLNEHGRKVTYANCFVLSPPQDNIESIFDTAKNMARTYSYGGGCGITLENLRPKGAKVNNSAKETTGAVSFADLYSMTTGLIGQAGRRGALMLSLPVTHPDIEEFINIKNDLSKINFANISVMITDDFMKAVKNNENWTMIFTVKDTGEAVTKTVKAKALFRKIAESNWKMAEPGAIFWDKVQNYHLNSEVDGFTYSSTNPCGEKPLVKDGNCLLSSFNLAEYVLNPFTNQARFDYDRFAKDIPKVVEYMDDLLEEGIPFLPLEAQKQINRDYRQLGIGVLGLADMLIKLGIKYGSSDSLIILEDILHVMSNVALQSSALLAKERGKYPKYTDDILKSEYLSTVACDETLELIEHYGLRNAELLSIAPTGSISTLWGVSGGLEPIFALSHNRRSQSLGDGEDVVYKVYAQIVQDYMDYKGVSDLNLPDYFITSHQINYADRIKFQAVAQKYVDSAISSTVNLPNSTTIEEIENLYMMAWEYGLKGVTVYRDGCMREGILTVNTKEEENKIEDSEALMCPDCNVSLEFTEGCFKCPECGWGGCSI